MLLASNEDLIHIYVKHKKPAFIWMQVCFVIAAEAESTMKIALCSRDCNDKCTHVSKYIFQHTTKQ